MKLPNNVKEGDISNKDNNKNSSLKKNIKKDSKTVPEDQSLKYE